jgi:large subunit ribosomal protein L15
MKLHELNPNEGAKRPRKRVGRGISAGQGKTAGRGTKGAGARAGGGTRLYHQGGNLPFFRRLPFKRGFVRINRLEWNEVNLDHLSKFKSGSEVTPASLEKSHLIRDPRLPVAILGRGEVKTALKVRVHRVSENAKAKIEAAGGSVELLSLNG